MLIPIFLHKRRSCLRAGTTLALWYVLLLAAPMALAQDAPSPTGTVTGTVWDGDVPLEGANIVLADISTSDDREPLDHTLQPGDATDANGTFRIVHVAPGRCWLMVSRVGYKRHRQAVQVDPGRTTTVEIQLYPSTYLLDELIVAGNAFLTQPTTRVAAARLKLVPGGTNLVSLTDRRRRTIATLADAVEAEPGVVIQEFFGGNDQPRINIRGSGIQSNPQSRGIMLMHNGFPLNFADGSFVTGLVEPRLAQHIEVYRGSNALRHGGTALGGALNVVAPTGRSANGLQMQTVGGTFGTFAGHLQYGRATEHTDVFVAGMGHQHQGFRTQNDGGRRLMAHLNVGHWLRPNLEMRVYSTLATLRFDVPGPINKAQLEADPTAISQGVTPPTSMGPNVVLDEPRRETQLYRAALRTAWAPNPASDSSPTRLSTGVAYQYVDDVFYFPVGTGVRSVQAHDLTVDFQVERRGRSLACEVPGRSARPPRWAS